MKTTSVAIAALTLTISAACAGVKVPKAQTTPAPAAASMWVEPDNLAQRDLFNGPWGAENAPDPKGVYTLVVRKHTGVNLGLTVKDEKGREWSVKQPFPGSLDSEAPVEVTLSRLLSGIGYHQPPMYFLPAFTLKDDFGKTVEVGGRFRLKDARLKETGFWKWEENPFVGTKPYQGLIVLLMMFNSTDLKNTNNSLYEYRDGDLVQQWYVTRDLGAALGDFNGLAPRKNHPETFETVPYLLGVNNGHVQFAYNGWYKNLVKDRISPEDVMWASELLGRLSDKQWSDAFRAGGYEPEVANRFIARFKEKIEQGRALGNRAADRDR
ncbi:MAG TPA: hypothetical protein VM096_00280 [Vicinamibacterales bacterium]|nr:hypothetical protein [Vicinamibacterales bacterium]